MTLFLRDTVVLWIKPGHGDLAFSPLGSSGGLLYSGMQLIAEWNDSRARSGQGLLALIGGL